MPKQPARARKITYHGDTGMLPGLLLDNIFVYLFRALRLVVRQRRAESWTATEGRLEGAAVEGTSYPRVSVSYWFTVDGASALGVDKRPFYLANTAKAYADRLRSTTPRLVVRYDPADPTTSIVRDRDQIHRNARERHDLESF